MNWYNGRCLSEVSDRALKGSAMWNRRKARARAAGEGIAAMQSAGKIKRKGW